MQGLRVLEFSGSPSQMGEAFGESCREQIAELCELRLRNALDQASKYGGRSARPEQLFAIARRCLEGTRRYDQSGHDELAGIARGAGLPLDQIMALGGLTDLRDTLAWGGDPEMTGGCTSFIVGRDASAEGRPLCGQTWDLATDNQPFVVAVHRRPLAGPQTWCVTTVGCLSLMGMNEHGIAVGTTNLRTLDARVGVPYLSRSVVARPSAVRMTTKRSSYSCSVRFSKGPAPRAFTMGGIVLLWPTTTTTSPWWSFLSVSASCCTWLRLTGAVVTSIPSKSARGWAVCWVRRKGVA